jgi:ComF family protein
LPGRVRASLLELLIPSLCPACDAPRGAGDPLLCAGCRAELQPLRELQGVQTALAYRGSAERLIVRHKFERRRDALRVLLEPLLARTAELPAGPLVPIPRHPARIRALGCDPVHELARALARRSGRPLLDRVLTRARPTPPQTGLSPRERGRNVRGSFAAAAPALSGMHVLLLDDVTTTGATLGEAARVLERCAGARVTRLALAGTPAGSPAVASGPGL